MCVTRGLKVKELQLAKSKEGAYMYMKQWLIAAAVYKS